MKPFAKLARPYPPVLDPAGQFLASQELSEWVNEAFIEPGADLFNADHDHLRSARIGFLWTSFPAQRRMLAIAGQAEMPTPPSSLGPWGRARFEAQIEQWFPLGVDFLITLYAPHAEEADDANFCALVEHELYHCSQRADEFGNPKFRSDGTPVYGLKDHDVEEFVGIVRRYGVGVAAGQTASLVQAAKSLPLLKSSSIAVACGTCRSRVA